ncbi:hypothetical protein [Dyella sp.]|uniref:hypothetical protein n=1 Tax=Dyella sp. TaxID=1869338 RepID=UPI002ED162F7
MNNPVPSPGLRASRLKLLLIVAVFMAPIIAAGVLTLSGWQPDAKGNGLPISPQRNFEAEHVRIATASGGDWPWRASEPKWTLLVLAGPGCATHCLDVLTRIAWSRQTLSQNAKRLRLVYVGEPPAGKAREAMDNYWQVGRDVDGRLSPYQPQSPDTVAALLVESNGTALSLYPAGFDPMGLHKDLQKVIR